MPDRVPPALLHSGGRTEPEARERGEVPGTGKTQFVSKPAEGLNSLRGDSGALLLAAAHPDLHRGASEKRAPLQALVANRSRRLDRLPEDGICSRKLADLGQGGGQVGQELQASGVFVRQQLGSPAEQVDCPGHVATRECPRSCCL